MMGSPFVFIISITIFIALFTSSASATKLVGYPDLPGPLPSPKTVPAGSLVIPMDNLQNIDSIFNIRAYGLAVRLLYAEVPIYWSIRAGKAKDAFDFIAPALLLGSTGQSTNVSFAGGPLVIPQQYATTVTSLIASAGYSDVVVYTLTNATTIDVRHALLNRPKALISNLSTYAPTISRVLIAAGLVEGTHFVTVNQTAASLVISSLGNSSCYSMFYEPHYVFDSGSGPAYLSAVKDFARSGGNFYAQCAAINSYENGTSGGTFMSQYGVTAAPSTANQNLVYPYPDLPFSQFIGGLNGNNAGVTTEFSLTAPAGQSASTTDENAWWQPNAYPHVSNNKTAVVSSTGGQLHISTASKLTQDIKGGMVFYMGGHEYTNASQLQVSGRRMLLNAYLTPATRPSACGFDFCPLGESCTAGPCQSCTCGANNARIITNATCCSNGIPVTCPSITPSPTATPSVTATPSRSATPTPSMTTTPTPGLTRTPTPSMTPTSSPSMTTTPTPSMTTTPSPTRSPSLSPSPTTSPSSSPSPTTSPTPSLTTTPSPTVTPSPSSTTSPTSSPSLTPSPSSSPSLTPSPTSSPSSTPSPTSSPSSTPSPTSSPSSTPSPTSSPSSTPSPTSSPTSSPSSSRTPSPTTSPTTTPSNSPSSSPSPTSLRTPSPSPSSSASPSPSSSPSASSSPDLSKASDHSSSDRQPAVLGASLGLSLFALLLCCCGGVGAGIAIWRRKQGSDPVPMRSFAPFFVESSHLSAHAEPMATAVITDV